MSLSIINLDSLFPIPGRKLDVWWDAEAGEHIFIGDSKLKRNHWLDTSLGEDEPKGPRLTSLGQSL